MNAPVILDRHDDDRQRLGVLTLVGEPSHAASAIIENRSARPAVVAAIAARDHDAGGMLVGKELSCLLAEFKTFDEAGEEIFMRSNVHRILHRGLQIGIVSALKQGLVDRLYLAHLAEEDNLSRELPFVLFQILLIFRIDPYCLPADCAMT